MWIGNLMLLVINLPLVGMWVTLLKVPYWLLFPCILLMQEAGVEGYDLTSFFGWVAPSKTPAAIAEKLNEGFRAVAQLPQTAEKLVVTATVPFPATVKETEDFLKEQGTKWGPVVKASGAKID